MIDVAIKSNLIPIPPSISEIYSKMIKTPDILYRNGQLSDLMNLEYCECLHGIEFLKPTALYSSDHGVKGEEYDNVIFVIGRGWNNYNFERYMPMNPNQIADADKSAYERNRNLFYVCCSRPKQRLVLFITSPFESSFKAYMEGLVGNNNIYSFDEYVKQSKTI